MTGKLTLPSGAPVDPSSGARVQAWQVRAWRLWEQVGELHSPTSYIARVISRRIDWSLSTPTGRVLDKEQSDAVLQAAFKDTSVEEFTRLVALNMQVAADCWAVQTDTGWDVYAVTAPKLDDTLKAARNAGRQVFRVWDPNPQNTTEADSAVRTVLDPAEDLLILSALSRAQSLSRIAQAGILLTPAEAKFDGDPFGAGLEQAMTAAIRDVADPAAMVPIHVEMAKELIESVKHITFERPFDDHVQDKVATATRRIALGLDIPPELLLGTAEQNHWNAWLTQDETYRGTTAPLAEKIAAVLEQILTLTENQHTVVPDATELLAKRSSIRDAIDAARIGAVGLGYVREAMSANDADAPTDEDLEIVRSLTGRVSNTTAADRPSEPGA